MPVDHILSAFTQELADCHAGQLSNFSHRRWREQFSIGERLFKTERKAFEALRNAHTSATWKAEWSDLRSRLTSTCEIGMVPILSAMLFELSAEVLPLPDSLLHHDGDWPVSPLSLRRFTGNAEGVSLAICAWIRTQDPALNLLAEARYLQSQLTQHWGLNRDVCVDIVPQLFLRHRRAYVVGRMGTEVGCAPPTPLCLPLKPSVDGSLHIDAVFTSQDELLRIFDFTESPLTTKLLRPDHVLSFLMSLMPRKNPGQLASNIGHRQWAKLLWASELAEFLTCHPKALFQLSCTADSPICISFEIDGFPFVFDVVRDQPLQPSSLRQNPLLMQRPRMGGIVDAHLFNVLSIPISRLAPALRNKLMGEARRSIAPRDGVVLLRQTIMKQKTTALTKHLQQANRAEVERTASDFGHVLRQLASANIFPSHIAFEKFGICKSGRIVLCDLDGAIQLSSVPADLLGKGCSLLVPNERSNLQVAAHDLRRDSGFLLSPEYWHSWHRYHRQGGYEDLQPYPTQRALKPASSSTGPASNGLRGGADCGML